MEEPSPIQQTLENSHTVETSLPRATQMEVSRRKPRVIRVTWRCPMGTGTPSTTKAVRTVRVHWPEEVQPKASCPNPNRGQFTLSDLRTISGRSLAGAGEGDMTENHTPALVSFLMGTNTKKEAATPTNWVLTSQPKADEIFAGDKTGETVIVGDIVSKKGKLYKVRDIIWDVSGDGLYEETVFLVCENTRTGKIKTFTDNTVSLKGRPDNSDDMRWSEYQEKRIFVWRFVDAPPDLRALSPHGGDEDWVTFIPKALEGMGIGWAEKGTSFGCGEVSEHAVPGGKVRIGAHT